MDIYLNKEFVTPQQLLVSAAFKKYAIDRVKLMHLCMTTVLKDAVNSGKDIVAVLNQELIDTDQTELSYLINCDPDETYEQRQEKYYSWYILIATCALKPNCKEWVKEHEMVFLTVLSMQYTNQQLKKLWFSLRNDERRFKYATEADLEDSKGFLNREIAYVKVPCTQMCRILRNVNSKYMTGGYLFVEYEQLVRYLVITLLEQEWDIIWHDKLNNFPILLDLIDPSIINDIESFILTIRKNPKPLKPINHDLNTSNLQLPKLADESFPPCMSTMLLTFKQNNELKHDARKQLLLFLKDIGIPKGDILDMVKINYSKPLVKHKKDEVVRFMSHLLGISQTHKEYDSYNCRQMQEHPVADGYAHGCFFKKTSKRLIEKDLTKLGLSDEQKNLIHGKIGEKDYCGACTLHLQFKRGISEAPSTIVKPDDYFNTARCSNQSEIIDIEDLVI